MRVLFGTCLKPAQTTILFIDQTKQTQGRRMDPRWHYQGCKVPQSFRGMRQLQSLCSILCANHIGNQKWVPKKVAGLETIMQQNNSLRIETISVSHSFGYGIK